MKRWAGRVPEQQRLQVAAGGAGGPEDPAGPGVRSTRTSGTRRTTFELNILREKNHILETESREGGKMLLHQASRKPFETGAEMEQILREKDATFGRIPEDLQGLQDR